MKGSTILLSTDPKGVRRGGILAVAAYPGTWLQIQAGTAMKNGNPTWELYNPSSDGDPRSVWILLDDANQGRTPTAQIQAGEQCVVYNPARGEEMNVLVAGEAGTGSANAFTVGERLQGQHGTGKFIADATSGDDCPFTVMEHIDEVVDTDTLVFVMRS